MTLITEPMSHLYPKDLKGYEIDNQLATLGVLSPEWRHSLETESLARVIDDRLKSSQKEGLTAEERNSLVNRKLALLGGKTLGSVECPVVPVFGQHPACSRPGERGLTAQTDTRGSGD